MPRFSVVTACRNSARYIEETVKSVLSQTLFLDGRCELEYLVCDGASTDGTLELLAPYRAQGVIVVSEPDTGFYAALAKGLQRVSGDYVAYLNAGDLFHAGGLAIAAGQDLQFSNGQVLHLGSGQDTSVASGGALRVHTGQALAMLGGFVPAALGTTAAATVVVSVAERRGEVVDGKARFEVITPTLIRMEYAADGRFEDRPTMTVPRRPHRPPAYETSVAPSRAAASAVSRTRRASSVR